MTEQDTTMRAGDLVTPTVQLVRPLAEGGMGRVWIAKHTGLDTDVVVKLMSDEMSSRPDGAERFAREAAAAAAIKSPHVVQVFDHGVTEGGVPYIVMELLEGQDLAAHLADHGRMRPEEVVALVVQVGRALTKAHKAGIIHRDIKPDNIFLCDTRDRVPAGAPDPGGSSLHSGPHEAVDEQTEVFVKLLDFGTAKRAETVSKTTVPGQIMGTPYYMSPEQSVGADLDERSDIWSLGVVVFEALTGKKPFDGASIGAIALAIHGVAPKLSALVPELPTALDVWFEHCCAQKPEGRFATAREASTAFVEAVTGLAPENQPTESVFFPPVMARSSKPPVAGSGERTPMQPVSRSMPPLRETLRESTNRSRFTTIALGVVMALAAVTMIAIVTHRSPGESHAAEPVPSEILPARTTAPAAQPPPAPSPSLEAAVAPPAPAPSPSPSPEKVAAKEPSKPTLASLPKDEPKPAAHTAPRATTAKATVPPAAKGRHAKDGGAPAPGHEDDDLVKLQNVAPKVDPAPAPEPTPAAPPPPALPELSDPK